MAKTKTIPAGIKTKDYQAKIGPYSLLAILEDSGDWRVEKTVVVLDSDGDVLEHRRVPVAPADITSVIAIAEK